MRRLLHSAKEAAARTSDPAARTGRMVAILTAICLMSLADLYMTMAHATGAGMIEANPIARAIMRAGSPSTLILWKLATVGLGVAILVRLRRSGWAEAGAWLCLVVLAWLSMRWIDYSDQVGALTPYVSTMADADARWVRIKTRG